MLGGCVVFWTRLEIRAIHKAFHCMMKCGACDTGVFDSTLRVHCYGICAWREYVKLPQHQRSFGRRSALLFPTACLCRPILPSYGEFHSFWLSKARGPTFMPINDLFKEEWKLIVEWNPSIWMLANHVKYHISIPLRHCGGPTFGSGWITHFAMLRNSVDLSSCLSLSTLHQLEWQKQGLP